MTKQTGSESDPSLTEVGGLRTVGISLERVAKPSEDLQLIFINSLRLRLIVETASRLKDFARRPRLNSAKGAKSFCSSGS